jgi:metal-sulfur cluster biosynthetic enzyme
MAKFYLERVTVGFRSDVFERTYRVQSVPVSVTFGPPITTAELSPEERRKNLPDQVRKAISAGLERGRTSP